MFDDAQWQVQIDAARCTRCGACVEQCPADAIGWRADQLTLIAPDRCLHCATCEDVCPAHAVQLPFLVVNL